MSQCSEQLRGITARTLSATCYALRTAVSNAVIWKKSKLWKSIIADSSIMSSNQPHLVIAVVTIACPCTGFSTSLKTRGTSGRSLLMRLYYPPCSVLPAGKSTLLESPKTASVTLSSSASRWCGQSCFSTYLETTCLYARKPSGLGDNIQVNL
ncbi:hypothetical protein EJ03DRAFT_179831 [Teratosphaeria nubilosa]|uniref:Uncharacterized protein n=1 Tax=Teratosphaeria nubilosa TaxID=161662 RepID=A0A6G1L1L3_9PEZI|nr:hypothetical protein EJ03DRAFT_179831 [Teratosphaeria nubilosa]